MLTRAYNRDVIERIEKMSTYALLSRNFRFTYTHFYLAECISKTILDWFGQDCVRRRPRFAI